MKNKDLVIFFSGMVFMLVVQIAFGPQIEPIKAEEPPEKEVELLLVRREPVPLSNQTATDEPAPRIVNMKITAYCPCSKCCGKYADGITSTGKNAHKTVGVAADPKLLPYGTRLNIPGIGILPVDDTGGAMRQSAKRGIYHIDVRFPNHQEALNWGVKNLPVEILN